MPRQGQILLKARGDRGFYQRCARVYELNAAKVPEQRKIAALTVPCSPASILVFMFIAYPVV